MIVLEGPDGAGKSTLAHELAREFHLNIAPVRGPSPNVRDRVLEALAACVKGDTPIHIFDRFYYSELVYGALLRSHVSFNPMEQMHVERVLSALRCPVIWCLPKLDTISVNVGTGEDHLEGVVPQLHHIHRMYTWLAHRPAGEPLNSWEWDYESDKAESHLGFIKDRIHQYIVRRTSRTWAREES